MRKQLSAERSKFAEGQGLKLASRIFTYLTIGSLLCACIILSILLKGARRAHHELWEELLEQEKKTANAYQDVAADKVIVVEAEEKANVALRDVSFCKQDLEWSKKEVDQLKGTVKGLETQKDALIARIAEEEEANKEMLEELEDCRREAFALQQKATEAVETIDNALEQQLNDINQEASPARVRRRKHQNTMATKAHKNTNIGSLEDDALYESDQI